MLQYEIAGLKLSVDGAGDYLKERLKEYMLPLSKEGEHCCDYRVKIHKLDSLPEMMGDEPVIKGGMWKIATNRERTIYRGLLGMEEEVGLILQLQDQGAEIQILSPDKNPRDPRDYVSLGHAMEAFCLQEKRMILHSSCIIVNGKAILFSAPSGTGKSTHTQLWERYVPGTVCINDDTPALRLDREDAVYACGTPWSGSTTRNQNKQAPLAAIVLLRRGEENRITPIGGVDAYARILGQTRKMPFKESIEAASSLCAELMERVPVYDLACDISEHAVATVRDALGI